MNLLKDILLQLFFLFLPLFLYYHVENKYQPNISELKRQCTFFLYCVFSVLICMSFPIVFQNGHAFNLAIIPATISILYGGYLSGILTILILFVYPLFSSGSTSFLSVFLTVPFIMLLPVFLQQKWKGYPKNKKILLSVFFMTATLPVSFAFILYQAIAGESPVMEDYSTLLYSWLILSFSMLLLIYFIEYSLDLGNLRKQLKRMRRLQHVTSIAPDVSKEVHKPLTVIKGFTQLLGAEHNQMNKEYVPIILSELDRAESIINSYIKLATSSETIPAKSFSSKELIEHVMVRLHTYATNNHIEIDSGPLPNLRLRGNMELLSESFTSILKICLDAMPVNGGKIAVKNFRRGNDVIFELVDVGRGMNAATLQFLENYQYPSEHIHNDQVNDAFSVLFTHNGDIRVKRGILRKNVIQLTLPAYIKKKSRLSHKAVSP
ncbi:sensor histidine kinase [Bacillus tianshenii]|nr:sensor histidine kinase [Bacillus tianshenii]